MVIKKVTDCFFAYAEEQKNPYNKFPLGTEIEEFGAPYIEIGTTGKLAIVARDRGQECMRKETASPEVLAKWVYELFNKS